MHPLHGPAQCRQSLGSRGLALASRCVGLGPAVFRLATDRMVEDEDFRCARANVAKYVSMERGRKGLGGDGKGVLLTRP